MGPSLVETMRAAELAAELTVEVGVVRRSIEVVAAREGWEVRGRIDVGPSYVHRKHLVPYSAFYARPGTLSDAVRYVDRCLSGIADKEAAEDEAARRGR
jgi:hypothetical protein